MTNLNELAKEVGEINIANGWRDQKHEVATYLMLVVSELSEAMEADRKDEHSDFDTAKSYIDDSDNDEEFKTSFKLFVKDTFEDEIADAIIRLLDLADMLGIDIEFHVRNKMRYNKTRGYHHGGKAY